MSKAKAESGIKVVPDGYRLYKDGDYIGGITQEESEGYPIQRYSCYSDGEMYMGIDSLVEVLTALLDAAKRIQKEN